MNPTRLSFRKATLTDKEYLLRLREETMTEHLLNAAIETSHESHLQRINYQFEHAAIILLNEQPIGLLKIVEHPDKVEIIQIQIEPKYQGKGIGRRIISPIIERAFKKGLPVTLDVLKANKAKNLYQSLGFKIIDETSLSYVMEIRK